MGGLVVWTSLGPTGSRSDPDVSGPASAQQEQRGSTQAGAVPAVGVEPARPEVADQEARAQISGEPSHHRGYNVYHETAHTEGRILLEQCRHLEHPRSGDDGGCQQKGELDSFGVSQP